ncbi:MAG TPA: RuBisCO large subunit C-terminal-like domain-containing protein [Candidatus Hydrogenedentes bacterium]|nr:RuBisCO large subunit C-terminal-like domain-containing protein [Candidatus Hydrogenedentota bacterium]HRK34124.1 RuBisCO large subunit C-terminal-like domain-containing protein [Candidatus Hydrogenedentota bacterium]
MPYLDTHSKDLLWQDQDAREALLRRVVGERLAASPPPSMDDFIVATYFFALRTTQLTDAAEEISYLATSGVHDPPPGSLLDQCSAKPAGVDAFDETGRLGLAHVAIPLKMMQHPDGHVSSCDILHTIAGAGIFDLYERQDARLVALQIPKHIVRTFPGPAYGPKGIRKSTGFAPDQPAFGTILKPTAGITPEEVEFLVEEAAQCPLFLFVKEDEDLYPNLDYSPVAERARRAMDAIRRVQDKRGALGIIFAPHITGAPHEILDTVHAVLEHGVRGVMFSETFATGAVRMVREATKHLPNPPAIYGHNAGIGTRTRAIWREVIDLLARLDGIDFRQTAPLKEGMPFLRPYGDEWRASEAMLTSPIDGINQTMIVRAGGLDQGNIGLNLVDVEARGIEENILFLAGSAINSIKDAAGKANPRMGAEAMLQAIDVHKSGELREVSADGHVSALATVAERRGFHALREALRQRYPAVVP